MRYKAYLLLLLTLLIYRAGLAQTPPSGFTSTVVSSGWNEAVGLTFNSTGSKMFVWERPGKVWVVVNGQRQLLLDISPEVGGWHDHGLLGFTLDPNFDANGYFYLFYTVDRHHLLTFGTAAYSPTTDDYYSATIGRLTRYTATPAGTGYTVDQASRKILLGATKSTGVPSLTYSHLIGSLVFGTDGTLLVSTGDGAHPAPDLGSHDESYFAQALADGIITAKENVGSLRAQLVDCLSGKILRLDPATGAGVPSNPFYDAANPNAPRSKVWALGCRNPFRMSFKLGTGSTDPAAANPGVLYIGDVGSCCWEEINVVDRPRVNLGWPVFEGLIPNDDFTTSTVYNRDAPNPLYNTGGCTKQFFYFEDLIKQATPSGTATFTNSCNTGQAIPASIPTFVHTRPLIDWGHPDGPSRTGTFSGQTATTADVGAAGSPVSGPQFGGVAAVGGVFYPYTDFPAQYRNYFFGDYNGWIRTLAVNSSNQPSAVGNFVGSGVVPVAFATSPGETGLFYINFSPSEIRKISYGSGSIPPVAVASSNKTFGPGPLVVQFTGSGSTPSSGLTYLWDFGDGTTSTAQNPAHTFPPPTTPPITAPTKYTVTLTVRNSQGITNQTSLIISANNTPPQVTITSPAPNTRYPLTGNTSYDLRATVTDAEHTAAQLSYQWQTILHHEQHEHPNPIDTNPQTTTTLEPLGCGAETYYYRIVLTVTDAAGLATTKEIRLDPDCSTAPTYSFYRAIDLAGSALTLDGNAWQGASAPNYSTNGTAFTDNTVPLLPPTDAPRTSMIHSAVYNFGGLSVSLTAVPNGAYRVWAYVWEDNNAETYSLSLNGQTVRSNYNSGPAGTWAKLGPYDVTVDAGTVQLTTSGGAANLSGIEVWRASGGGGGGNPPPVANAGPDKTITLPTSSVSLSGSGTDDGTIAGYAWTQLSGPTTASFSPSATTAAPTVSTLAAGSYVFSLVVTDNLGALSAPDQVTVTVNPAPTGGSYAFYRAIDLAGSALTLDGNAWEGTSAPNYSTNGTAFTNNAVPLLPATDAPRTSMLRSSVYNFGGLSVSLTAVPAGQYQVWAYVWEDNNAEVFSLALNGQPVRSNYNSGPAGTWAKLGPYAVTLAAPGSLQLTTSGGTANLCGIEVWRASGGGGGNPPPVANAGPDKTITLPTSSVSLSGSGTDDGTIAGYAWTQLSGPTTASFSPSATTAAPTVGTLAAGSYVFSLIVTDNLGALSAPDQVTVTVNPAPGGGSYTFYRALNLNGPALTLDGNAWAGSTVTNYSTNGISFANNAVPLLPATDAPRTSMIRSSVYRQSSLTLTLSAVPAGSYQVYVYVWEDNNAEVFSLALNGQPVRSNYNSGPAGSWAKLGPYITMLAAPGSLQLVSSGGTANFSGIEVWQQQTSSTTASAALVAASGVQGRSPSALVAAQTAIYPNPSPSGRYVLEFPVTLGPTLTYTLLSPLGRILMQGQRQLAPGSSRTELDVSSAALPTGLYYLRLTGAQQQVQYKLLR